MLSRGRDSITAVVPTHNRSALLRSTLRTVLWQQGVDLEVIVVDDGSRDDTTSAVMALNDPRIRLVRHDLPKGVSAARNRGLEEATGEWVAFCDDDDLWAPDKLAEQLTAARERRAAWVYTGAVNITPGNVVVGGDPPPPPEEVLRRLPEHNVVPGGSSGVMVERTVLVRVGGFDAGLQPLADWDLWLRLAVEGTPACVARPLVAYRVHGSQMSLDARLVESEFAVIARRDPQANRAIMDRYLGWWSLRVRHRLRAFRYFVRGAARLDAAYPARAFVGDVVYLVRATAEDLRGRYAGGLIRAPLDRPRPPEDPAWRDEAKAWIDAVDVTDS